MRRIDGAGHVGFRFVHEDVASGRPPTEVTDSWLNSVQEEICGVIEGSGIALDPLNSSQLLQAIRRIMGTVGSPAENSAFPAGAVLGFARLSAPPGWIIADGAAVSRTTYASLFAAIGTTFGAGDGVDTFNLPQANGVFIRGADLGRGLDEGRVVGSYQEDQTRSHSHAGSTAAAGGHSHTGTTGPAPLPVLSGQVLGSSEYTGVYGVSAGETHTHSLTTDAAGSHSHSVTVGLSGGNETRPVNLALLHCIKT